MIEKRDAAIVLLGCTLQKRDLRFAGTVILASLLTDQDLQLAFHAIQE